jgi:hypothetical protein
MTFIFNKKVFFKFFIISLILLSFFLGYFLRENAVGGGTEFFELSWPITQSFREDFFFTIHNYGTFRDYTIPFSHILNAYLNPFSNNIETFQASTTVISFITFLIFSLVFKKIFFKINFIDILLVSSVLLILPFYRTSAFWGKNENYGWLFFILAVYFFSEIKKNINKSPNNREIINIILFCFASSCALYARQALAFLPIAYFLYLIFYKANIKIFITSIISFSIFAIPSILLIIIWGNVYDARNLNNEAFFGWWINYKHLLKNFPILLSFFGFYLLPVVIIDFFNVGIKEFLKNYLKSFLISLIILIIFGSTGLLDYLGEYTMGGGAVLKINYLIEKNNFFLLLVFSSIGFSIITRFLKEDLKNNIIILLPIFSIYCFPNVLGQEYVEPLILIIFFLLLKTNLHITYFKNINFSNFIFLSYFVVYLIGSIYFKHYAFDSYDKWLIFLGVQ